MKTEPKSYFDNLTVLSGGFKLGISGYQNKKIYLYQIVLIYLFNIFFAIL
jgi:hypothetical protein